MVRASPFYISLHLLIKNNIVYVNSLLSTLNARKSIRDAASGYSVPLSRLSSGIPLRSAAAEETVDGVENEVLHLKDEGLSANGKVVYVIIFRGLILTAWQR